MIVEVLLNAVFGVLTIFLKLLPDISINVDSQLFSAFMDSVSMVLYLLPMGTVMTIYNIIVLIIVFRIVVALIKTVWDLLPIV